MRPFARHYDALYADKDYSRDARMFWDLCPEAINRRVLEIGCGTGNHSFRLAEKANVTAVEIDHDFAAVMQEKLKEAPNARITLFEKDIAQLDDKGFDAAAAFFYVVNYVADDAALIGFLKEIKARLKPDAPFLFDMWHGDAVLNDPPHDETRERCGFIQTITPKVDAAQRRTTLHYDIRSMDGSVPSFSETITMRVWLKAEIETALHHAGFHDLSFYDARDYPETLKSDSWTAFVCAR